MSAVAMPRSSFIYDNLFRGHIIRVIICASAKLLDSGMGKNMMVAPCPRAVRLTAYQGSEPP